MIVVAGEMTLYLDDGVRTVLKAGDVCVQRGTNHAWANHGTEIARLVGVLLDGKPKRTDSLHGAQQAS
jgi:quercetin dioxygenase-like cupin family protein